jgi:hypothetical protein
MKAGRNFRSFFQTEIPHRFFDLLNAHFERKFNSLAPDAQEAMPTRRRRNKEPWNREIREIRKVLLVRVFRIFRGSLKILSREPEWRRTT